jgi:putative hemolysin
MGYRTLWTILVVAGALCFAPPISSEVALGESDEAERLGPAIPDPASQRCERMGGISRAVDAVRWGGAQVGLCRLHDDSLVAAWTLFRAAFGDMNQAVSAFLEGRWIPMPGPVETWGTQACEAAGGQVAEYVVHLRPDSVVHLCEFPDLSSIETWTLFSGPEFYPELARALVPSSSSGLVFRPCPWPRTCMAPCIQNVPPDVFCLLPDDSVEMTSFPCCCCGSGINSFAPIPGR